jgi:DNA modification methylase
MPKRGTPSPPLTAAGHELVWEGKYDSRGRRIHPAPSRGTSLVLAERFPGNSTTTSRQPDRLIQGDNWEALPHLTREFQEAIQLIYLDPPFGSEADYSLTLGERASNDRTRTFAYGDRWGPESSYLVYMAPRLAAMRNLLTPSGVLFLHCDWHSHAPLRLLLDEIFGADHFINEIVWHYYNKYSRGRHRLPRAHDSILVYGKTRAPLIHPLRIQRPEPQRQLVRENIGGVLRNARDASGRLMYRVVTDKKLDDVWTIPQLQPASAEWTGYATQKHPLLLERVLTLASRPGDWVADFFCGSGTTLSVAQRMDRRFIGCDIGEPAVHIAKRRLIAGIGSGAGLDVYRVEPRAKPGPPKGAPRAATSRRASKANPPAGIRVELTWRPAGVRIRLVGVDWPASSMSPTGKADALKEGLARVDLWAVDPDPRMGHSFQAAWCAARPRKVRGRSVSSLALETPPLAPGSSTEAWVKVWDALGTSVETRVKLKTPARSKG